MRSYIEFLTTPTADSAGTALLLHFDNKRYIIGNAHEGLQRAIIQRGKKLNRVTDVLLTGKTEWKNIGGLIGIVLTLADSLRATQASIDEVLRLSKIKNQMRKALSIESLKDIREEQRKESVKVRIEKHTLTIHGSPNVTHTLATARKFVFRKGMPVDVKELSGGKKIVDGIPTWFDENIRVWAMSIEPYKVAETTSNLPSQGFQKRRFEDYAEELSAIQNLRSETLINNKLLDQEIRRGVVSDMFDSEWRLDALFETPLAKVQMPAALFIRNDESNKIEKYSGPMPGGTEKLPEIDVLVRRPWPGALVAQLPPTKPSTAALSYIIRTHPQRGKFLPQKAVTLKVPKGPLFSDLASGMRVTLTDGTTIKPEDVLGPGNPGGGLAVAELPTDEYVLNLVNRPEWKTPSIMEGVGAIVWILGPGVLQNKDLRGFMTEMGHMKHIVSSRECCPNSLSLDSAAAAAIKLYQIDPDRYSIPTHDNQRSQPWQDGLEGSGLPKLWVPAIRGLQVQLTPAVLVQEDQISPPLDTAKAVKATPKDALLLAKLVRQEISSEAMRRELDAQNLPSPDAEIIFLGTGSALPSKYRNVSGTLLRVPGSGSYLFDCGEGTLGQLSRIYTQDELGEVLQDLKMIWISHLHADHHLGTTSVIKAWYQAVYGENYQSKSISGVSTAEQLREPDKYLIDQKRLFIASSEEMNLWLEEYASVEDFGYEKLVPLNVWSAKLGKPKTTRLEWDGQRVGFETDNPLLDEIMRKATGLTQFAAASVPHCHGAKGVAVTFPTGFKFTYSGDCRPTKSLVEIGKGSTVLLHEATFDDELRGDAEAKLHSTTSEAIGVGIAMHARRILLTHFSQRYQKIPIMDGVDGQDWELEDGGKCDDDDPMVGMTSELDDESEMASKKKPTANSSSKKSIGEMIEDDSTVEELLGSKLSTPNSQGSIRIANPNPRLSSHKDVKVGVAFDYMRVKVRDIALLEKFTPALMKLYDQPTVGDSDGESDKEKTTTSTEGKRAKERNKSKSKTDEKTKIGGGKMGRVKQTRSDRESMRNGTHLF